jgi:anti-anti-sigma factor
MITKHPTSRTLVVHPVGNLEALTAEYYRQQLHTLVDEGYCFIIFDLEEMTHINSSGLGLLIEFFNVVRQRDGALKLIHCSEQMLWILRQAKLDRMLMGDEPADRIAFDPLHALMNHEILMLSHVHQVTEQVLKLDSPLAIGHAILQGTVAAIRSPLGAILFLNETQDRLSLVDSHASEGQRRIDRMPEIPLRPERLESRLLERDEVTWHNLRGDERDDTALFRRLGFQTMLATPIFGQNRKFGLMALEANEETGALMQFAKPFMQTLAHICGLALQKTMLMGSLNERNEELVTALERVRQCQLSLIDAGHLVSMGTVVGGLCHLLNNKMVPLVGYSQLLGQTQDLPEPVRRKVATIGDATQEIAQIIEKLVQIARMRERVRDKISLNDLVHSVLDLLTASVHRRQVDVQLRLTPHPPELHGESDQFLQALIAVVHHACTSFDDDGRDHWIRIASSVETGNLRLVIEDNGRDFSEDSKADWIDPLAAEDAIATGQIFSYTIPRSVVRRMQGQMVLETRPTGGKRVIIDLPTASAEAAAQSVA